MGVRFFCPNCRCVLLIARRKAGTEIHCPRCSQAQTVPTESDPLAVIAGRRPGTAPGASDAGQSPVDAEGMILHWIEGDEPSTEHAQAFDGAQRHGGFVAPSDFPPSPTPAPFMTPQPYTSSASGEVAFEELPVAAPPVVRPADHAPPAAPLAAPPIVHAATAYEQPASRLWLVLFLLSVFTAAVAGAFIAGYFVGRQSGAMPSPQGGGPQVNLRPVGSIDG